MSLALSQRLGPQVKTGSRLVVAFFNTDENFALGMTRLGKLTVPFFLGVGCIAALGWVCGTALGSLAGTLLPLSVRTALGVMLYGMFIAVVIPQARQEKPMLLCLAAALVLSCLFAWVPGLNSLSPGLAIIICTVVAAAICAVLFPIEETEVAE